MTGPDARRAGLPGHEPGGAGGKLSSAADRQDQEATPALTDVVDEDGSTTPTSSSSPTASPRAWRCRPSRRRGPEGSKVGSLRLRVVWPFPEHAIARTSPTRVKAFVVPELNMGQMVREVERLRRRERACVGVPHAGGTVHDPDVISRRSWRHCDERATNRGRGQPGTDHPIDRLCACDRMPHIWCPGCGIGTTVNCFTRALDECGPRSDRLAIVSGIGCTGRVAGYMKLDSFHTTHGRAIPFATGLKLANPKLKVVVYSRRRRPVRHRRQPLHPRGAAQPRHDGHLRQQPHLRDDRRPGDADRRPRSRSPTTAPTGTTSSRSTCRTWRSRCGAVYVARWTVYHVTQLKKAIREALLKPGFSFVEVDLAVPHALRPAQPHRRRPRRAQDLQGAESHQERRGHQDRRARDDRPDCRRASSSTASGRPTRTRWRRTWRGSWATGTRGRVSECRKHRFASGGSAGRASS